MKKRIYHFLLRLWAIMLALVLGLCAIASNTQASVPEAIKGIWKSDNKLIYFGDGVTGAITSTTDEFLMALGLYYTWYYDLAAFSDTSQIVAKKKNAASSSFPEEFHISFKQLQNSEGFVSAYELTVTDASLGRSLENQSISIPIAAVDNELFLDFYIKNKVGQDTFYQSVNSARDIAMNGRVDAGSLECILVHNGAAYETRYWKAPISEINGEVITEESGAFKEKVTFQGVKAILEEPKYITSCGVLYTCATGRRKKARNVKHLTPEEFATKVGEEQSGNSIVIKGESAFKKLDGAGIEKLVSGGNPSNADALKAAISQDGATVTKAQFLSMIDALNSRRVSDPKPLFPVKTYYDKMAQREGDLASSVSATSATSSTSSTSSE